MVAAEISRNRTKPSRSARIALIVQDLGSGGAERVMVTLANALSDAGHHIDLLVCLGGDAIRAEVSGNVNIIMLDRTPTWRARLALLRSAPTLLGQLLLPVLIARKPSLTLPNFLSLTEYLHRSKPQTIISALPPLNVETVLATRLAKVSTRVIITEHGMTFDFLARKKWRNRFFRDLMKAIYPMADTVVSVSEGIKKNLSREIKLPISRIKTIYNPVVPGDIQLKTKSHVEHKWLNHDQPPVILAVGRISREKDFPTLLKAFARVRKVRAARLIILGEAAKPADLAHLRTLAEKLGIQHDSDFPGFVENPFAYMARSAMLVVSSLHEGFGNVIAEALASGCPVVSTDCPSGPAEILEKGRYGRLVPVGDDAAMAESMLATLDNPAQSSELRERASLFSTKNSTDNYEKIIFE
ncbi:MAG: glycosyltransferase [bacterium]